jgi:hypothetical protein
MSIDEESFQAGMARYREWKGDTTGKMSPIERLAVTVFALEQHIGELKARTKDFQYVGVFKAEREYKRGNFVTHAGSVWHCDEPTTETPGKSNAWTLAVKSTRS